MDIIDNPKFDDWIFQDSLNFAKDLFEKEKQIPGMLIQGYTKKTSIMVHGMFDGEDEKARFFSVVKLILSAFNVTHYTLISEVWISRLLKGEVRTMMPSEDPNRTESLMVISVNYNRTRNVSYRIKRKGKSRIKLLKGDELDGSHSHSGRIYDFLPPRGWIFPMPGKEQDFIDFACKKFRMGSIHVVPKTINPPDDVLH